MADIRACQAIVVPVTSLPPTSAAPRVGNPRILQVAEAFGGGVLEVVRTLSNNLVDDGFSVAIAYGQRPETPTRMADHFDPRVELIPMPWGSRSAVAQARSLYQVSRLISAWRPDIVHLHSSFAGAVGVAAVHGRTPTIYTPHGYAFLMTQSRTSRRAFTALEWCVGRTVTIVGAVSQSEAEAARSTLGLTRVEVIPNGIPELDPPVPHAAGKQGRRVVAVGRIRPQRRPAEVAEILAGVRDVAAVEWLGGGPESESGFQALAARGISISGWLPRDELLKRLALATVYLHWTAWDGHPLSVLEALARDVVVVGSDIPPNRELLGGNQVFRDRKDAIDFTRSLLTKPELVEMCLANQRARR